MGRQKKPKKKKPPQPTVLTAEEKAEVLAILQEAKTADTADLMAGVPHVRHALAIIEQTSAAETPSIPLLLALKEKFEDKVVQKAVKRALFRLEQKGFPIDESFRSENTPSIIRAPQIEGPRALLGPILNLSGSRAVSVTHHKAPSSRLMGLGLVSDQEGFHDFRYGEFSKKRTKRLIDQLSENAGPLVETSLSHAGTVLETAYRRHLRIHPKSPAFYPELRPWLLENAPLLDRPVVFDFFAEEETNKEPTDPQLAELFNHELLKKWLVEFNRMTPFFKELMKAEDSPIVLSGSQKSEQERRIRQKCMAELFPAAEQKRLRQSLEEMSFVFFKLDHRDLSRLCLDAARSIDLAEDPLQKNTVVEFLVEKNFNFYLNLLRDKAPEKKESTIQSEPRLILP